MRLGLLSLIINNQIISPAAATAINVSATSPSVAYTRIQHNQIFATICININNLNTYWQNPPYQKVLINFNELYPKLTTNLPANFFASGIAVHDCEGITIGNNTIEMQYGAGASYPDYLNAHRTRGIEVNNCRNAFVGCNEIEFAGHALRLSGDVRKDPWNTIAAGFPVQFQSNQFSNCFHGIYFDLNAQVSNFGEPSLAADNQWLASIGPPFAPAQRIKDDRTATSYLNYYYSGANNVSNPRFPESTPSFPDNPFLFPYPGGLNNCNISLPTHKQSGEEDETTGIAQNAGQSVWVYPNPANLEVWVMQSEGLLIQQLEVLDLNGRSVYVSRPDAAVHRLDVSAWPRGVYIVQVATGNLLSHVRVVVQ